nr:putative ribonuclease H-like domain-containing protein [Tanacetum cinerariifolium]
MKPFSYPVTILNTLDHLGKFQGKVDEGFLIGYSVCSKAFRNNAEYVTFDGKEHDFDVQKPKSKVILSPSSSAQSMDQDDKIIKEAKGKSHVKSFTNYRYLNAEFHDCSKNSNMPGLEDIIYSDDEDVVGAEADFNNLEPSIPEKPKRVHQALKDPSWIEAMQEELLQFKIQKVWVIVDLPYGKRAIGTKWVYRNKKDERGIVIRNKVRLVAQGHTQEEGIGYDEVFAPIARIEAIRLFLAYASCMGFMVYQMDVKSAFLYGTIEEEVYVCQPLWFEDTDHPDKVYKVVKALYGLHQDPRAWYETLATYLFKNGFQRGIIDQTLFIKKQKGHILLVQIYVDDIIFGATNKDLCRSFEKLMKDKFQMSSMGELAFFLGLQVKQKEDGIFISQDKYVTKILRKFGLTEGKSVSTPIDTEKPLLKDPNVKRIFRYLKGKPHLGLWYPKDSPFDLVAYSDSDYAGASLDRKSTTRGCQFLRCRLISWQCKKQTIVATSSTEAEYVVAASWCAQVLWIQNQLLNYGVTAASAPVSAASTIISATELNIPAATITAAPVKVAAASTRRRRGVVIRDPEEESIAITPAETKDKGKGILVEEPKPVKKKQQAKEDLFFQRYQVMKKRPQTEAQGRRNMIIQVQYKYGVSSEVKGVNRRRRREKALESINETPAQKAAKRRRLNQEDKDVEEIKQHLEIVPDKDDDVYTEATPLARKVPVVDYLIIHLNNKPRYKIIRADETHQLYVSFITLLKNFDREDLESLWSIVKESQVQYKYGVSSEVKGVNRRRRREKALESINETPAQKAAKRRRLNQEDKDVEEIKQHLEIVPDKDDDVYTEATPLARKVPVVDYLIIHLNNKPRYKIIRADETHQLYVSFITLLKNFDREDLESLWSIVKERFSTSKPNNFFDAYLLTTLRRMFGRPDGQDNLILLVERRYLLSRFTLEQMLNVVRLQVEEQSEMCLELIRSLKKNTKCVNAAGEELSAVKHKLMMLDNATGRS